MRIPVIIPYEDDEILYSWIARLSDANGFDRIQDFINIYINNEPQHNTFHINYNIRKLYNFIDNLDGRMDVLQLITDTTLFPFYSIFLSDKNRIEYCNDHFRYYTSDTSLSRRDNDRLSELRCCPKCMEDDVEKHGYYYYHRLHQLPGIRMCPVHNIKLIKYDGCYGHELKEKHFTEVQLNSSKENELKYAEFLYYLHTSNLTFRYEDILNYIWKGLEAKNARPCAYSDYLSKLKEKDLISLLDDENAMHRFFNRYSNYYSKEPTAPLVLMMDLCESYSDIPSSSEHLYSQTEENKEYEILSTNRYGLSYVKHNRCGYKFITYHKSISDGWHCPRCDSRLPDDVIIGRVIEHISNGDYTLMSGFTGWSHRITLRHNTCGNIYDTNPISFIYHGKRCICTIRITEEKVRRMIESNPEFELTRFTDIQKPIYYRHKICGHISSISYQALSTGVICTYCDVHKKRISLSRFRELIADCVGEDYKVIKAYNDDNTGKCTLLHTVCGNTFEIFRSNFFRGTRCPYCSDHYTMDEFRRFVEAKSGGEYVCMNEKCLDGGKVELIRSATGDKIILERRFAIQELSRSSPSSIIPLRKKAGHSDDVHDYTQLYQQILREYGPEDIIYIRDIASDLTPKRKNNVLKRMVREKMLRKVPDVNGYYTFYENRKKYTAEMLITHRFLWKNGKITGYLSDRSFLHAIGFIRRKPEMLHITSALCNTSFPQYRNLEGIHYSVTGTRCSELNERNILFLPLLDLLAFEFSLRYFADRYYEYLSLNNISLCEIEEYLPFYPQTTDTRIRRIYREGENSDLHKNTSHE